MMKKSTGFTLIVAGIFVLLSPVCPSAFGDLKPKVMLDLKHQVQGPNMCVPTSAAIVMNYYGVTADPAKIMQLGGGSQKDGMAAEALTKALKNWEFNWPTETYRVDSAGFKRGLKDILTELSADRPVLIHIHSRNRTILSHIVTLIGYDIKRQEVYYLDTAAGPKTLRIGFKQLNREWSDDPKRPYRRYVRFTRKQGEQVSKPNEFKVDTKTLAGYVGKYRYIRDRVIRIFLKDNQLHVEFPDYVGMPVFADSKTDFHFKGINGKLSFQVDKSGKTTAVRIDRPGLDIVCRRIK